MIPFSACQAEPPLPAKSPQPPTATATEASAASQTAYVSYNPPTGTFPVWGYPYPSFQTAITASSVTPTAPHKDSVTSITASGTFAYPYPGVQYSSGKSAYVPPQLKYPYGAPALPTAASSSSSTGAESASSSAQSQNEWIYNGIQWKQPYTGPRDAVTPVDLQAQNELLPSVDRQTPTPVPDKALPDIGDLAPSGDNSVSLTASKELSS